MRLCNAFPGVICLLGFTTILPEVIGYNLVGCYLDNENQPSLTGLNSVDVNQSSQKCGDICTKKFVYAGVRDGSTCMCGNAKPPDSLLVQDNSLCNIPCPGNPQEKCGGKLYMSVWIVGSQTSNDTISDTSPSQSTNKGGLIGGIVGGVLGLLLITGGGIWWYRRKKRNQQVDNLNEEKYNQGSGENWVPRRRSDVTLRDDFDYTHALKVTNPDP
ncbi:WSC-domain-containing protein [Basidiobolus meristosporus CBS 931.73]|uniref:WSC-domain-containing protein n=1 Tax=Basidiobolus meristosporus CBS 931.73 TaxID=1314790 RepID=A0A1Y1X3S5_9FUNG|nr:WSC-domain-containing protein [Basidiobolus meristosporus CBS 931.73]|eukprot:ORX80461.1 WSC-domain-containing protein [Basidiobolus meristosporus CBS 931.73]